MAVKVSLTFFRSDIHCFMSHAFGNLVNRDAFVKTSIILVHEWIENGQRIATKYKSRYQNFPPPKLNKCKLTPTQDAFCKTLLAPFCPPSPLPNQDRFICVHLSKMSVKPFSAFLSHFYQLVAPHLNVQIA